MSNNIILTTLSQILQKLSYKAPAEIYFYPQETEARIIISYQDGDHEVVHMDDLIEPERFTIMGAIYGLQEQGLINAPIYQRYLFDTKSLFVKEVSI